MEFFDLVATLGIIFFVIMLLFIISFVFIIIGIWKSFKKAGRRGCESLIIGHNLVVLMEISGINIAWIFIVQFVPLLFYLLIFIIPPFIILILFATVMIYFQLVVYISLARSFGKSTGFAMGLMFLPVIFWPILGGKNTEYIGKKPFDPLLGKLLNENEDTVDNSENVMYNNMNNINQFNNNMNNVNSMNNNMNNVNQFNNNMNNVNSMNNNMNNVNQINNNMNNIPNNNLNNNFSGQGTINQKSYCKTCGAEIAPGEDFCRNCGTRI